MFDFWKKHSLCSLFPFVWVLRSNQTTKLAKEIGKIAAAKTKIHFSAQQGHDRHLRTRELVYTVAHIQKLFGQAGNHFSTMTGCRSRACNSRLLLRPGTRNPVDSQEISNECVLSYWSVPSQHTVHRTDPGILKHTLDQLTRLKQTLHPTSSSLWSPNTLKLRHCKIHL